MIVLVAGGGCAADSRKVTPGQILLYVDTDAPIPAGPGQEHGLATPLFDRVRIDVVGPKETAPCPTCSNEFEVNALLFAEKSVSIGIAPPLHASGYRARVRLFKTSFAGATGEPNADSTLETTVTLPVVDEDAIVRMTVSLSVENVAQPVGSLDAPAAPALGPPADSQVGHWSGAARLPCHAASPPGAVCVPGGAYWMGDPNAPGFNPSSYVLEPRLVVLSPFFMSTTEVTVSAYRAKIGTAPSMVWSGSREGQSSLDWCTYASTPGPLDVLPMNCITRDEASSYCKAMGGDLPSEAQFEYVEGGLSGNVFPWGRDEPSCADAAFGASGWGVLTTLESPCRADTPPGGPAVPGTKARDRFDLPNGTIFDLAGNMGEWTGDVWNRIGEPCWDRAGVHRDPRCTTSSPADGPLAVRRGGDWISLATYMVASTRFALDPGFANIQTGFRCVWPSP
jgi:formylglycine-generating enzyme required for sulfatase activity